MTTIRPYGSWPSTIDADQVAAAGRRMTDLRIDDAVDPPQLYWIESVPEQAGRNTLMRMPVGGDSAAAVSLLASPMSARSAVHEYGGAAFAVHAGRVWFVNAADQAVWQFAANAEPAPLTDPQDDVHFVDLQVDTRRDRLFVVAETPQTDAEPRATVEAIDSRGQRQVIAEGHDFYASPRLAPAGDRLVWLAWNHPDMPWDATELWQASIATDGTIGTPIRRWAPRVSLFGPVFAPDGWLHVVCDADNWWNLYREPDPKATDAAFIQLTGETAEFAVPQWVFGQSCYGFGPDGRLYAMCTRHGRWQLGEVDTDSGRFDAWLLAPDFFEQLCVVGDRVIVIAGDAQTPKHILSVDTHDSDRRQVLRSGDGLAERARLSSPESVSWPTADNDIAHGLFYAPANADYAGPGDERPPLILKCHGGPTGATSTALDARIQYWTSRGFAVLDVNYRGSTGYGRAYRAKLNDVWGVADVADCVYGARYLAERGDIDGARVLISGSSAGGYTVLCVLTFTDAAAAGASYYGIGDLSRLMASTHKFESRYLDRLIGVDPARLQARSPLAHAGSLRCPVLFLQGLKDRVVPPDQAETMAAALREQGVPVAYVTFADERHGFRDAANIRTAINSERVFYRRVLAIESPEDEIDLAIDNFDG